MEASPLRQTRRPTSFQPKIAQLYDELFAEEEDEIISDGFWREFFILKPDKPRLQGKLERLSANDLLHLQVHTEKLTLGNFTKSQIARDATTISKICSRNQSWKSSHG